MDDNETIFTTEDGVRVSVSEWDDGGAWISLQMRGASTYVSLTKDEAESMIAGLLSAIKSEVRI
jgi:hypothetical protein